MPNPPLPPRIHSHTRVNRGCTSCSSDIHSLDEAQLTALQKNPALAKAMQDDHMLETLLDRPAVAARLLRRKLPLALLKKLRNGNTARLRRELNNPPALTLANGCRVQPSINLRITHGEVTRDGNE